MTMTLISTATVGVGGAATIDFTSIPQTYTDLQLVWSTRDTRAAWDSNGYITFNGSSSGYASKNLDGTGSTAESLSNIGGTTYLWFFNNGTLTTNTFGNSSMYIPNYTSSSSKFASSDQITENTAINAYQSIFSYSWSGTSAITSITITAGNNPFIQNSTASLYGILKGSGGATVS